jgi:hypothetical protein
MQQEVAAGDMHQPVMLLLVVILLEQVTWLLQMDEAAEVVLVKMVVMGA